VALGECLLPELPIPGVLPYTKYLSNSLDEEPPKFNFYFVFVFWGNEPI
jgi:hypothetical protein